MTSQLAAADVAVTDQGETVCCYAKSDKGWVHDPQGIAWESFVTFGEATTYGVDSDTAATDSACCVPTASVTPTAQPSISLKDIAITPVAASAASCGTPAQAGAASCC
jgi:hypothetical protein